MADFSTGTAQGIPRFRYPANLGSPPFDKFIIFDAMSGRHVVRNQVVVEQDKPDVPVASVAMYLPEGGLLSTTSVAYDQTDLGPMVGAAVEFLAQTGTNIMGNKGGGGELQTYVQGFKDVSSRLQSALSNGGWKELLKQQATILLEDLVPGGAATVGAAIGQKPNPRTDLLYSAQEYRLHDLDFLLVPRSLDEAKAIDNICYFFNFYMLPRYQSTQGSNQAKIGAFMIGFPYEFNVSMLSTPDGQTVDELQHVNKIGRSVLKSVTINHAAGGKTSFIKDNGDFYPTATRLQLSFQEVRLLARDDEEIQRAQVDTSKFPDPRA